MLNELVKTSAKPAFLFVEPAADTLRIVPCYEFAASSRKFLTCTFRTTISNENPKRIILPT